MKLYVRHETIDMLEKLKELTLYVRHALSNQFNQDIFLSHIGLIKASDKKKGNERILKNNEIIYHINTISEDKLGKGIINGHFLSGYITFFKDSKRNLVVNFSYSHNV